MCDILDLLTADYPHIMRWAAKLGGLSRQHGEESRSALVSTWLTLASLIKHMRARPGLRPAARKAPRAVKDRSRTLSARTSQA
jgi:hypothetical protein